MEQRLRLDRFGRKLTDEQEKEISLQYMSGKSASQLTRELNLGEKLVRNALRRTNTPKRTRSQAYLLYYNTSEGIEKGNNHSKKLRKYSVNEDFFAEPLNPISAYILGFWLADGNMEFEKGVHTISFSQMEENILIKIKIALNATYPIYKMSNGKKGYKLLISSKKLCEDIEKICPFDLKNKSLNAEYPLISKELDHHLIRGIFDGDGGIYYKGKRQMSFHITGTEKLNIEIQRRLMYNCNLKKTKILLISTFSRLTYAGNEQVTRIMNWLYKDAEICLERKKRYYEEAKEEVRKINKDLENKRNEKIIGEIKNAIIHKGIITLRGIIKWIRVHYKREHSWHTINKYLGQMIEKKIINEEKVYTGGEILSIFK